MGKHHNIFGIHVNAAGALLGVMVAGTALADPLGADRIAELPESTRPAWDAYWSTSQRLRAIDETFIQKELKTQGEMSEWTPAPTGHHHGYHFADSWYASGEARKAADCLLSFQTPAGGWGKNLDNISNTRRMGTGFTESHAHYRGTFDNNATIREMRVLGRIAAAQEYAPARAGFLRGLEYILEAQYPNGGWPQVYPLEGGYHDNITFNDGAMIHVMRFLGDVANGDFPFVDDAIRQRARAAEKKGLQCILDCQAEEGGAKTIWCAQHDPLTLKPTKARSFEWASLSGGESAGITVYLMDVTEPSVEVSRAVEGAYRWFYDNAIYGKRFVMQTLELVDDPDAGAIWARFYELETGRPIFVERNAVKAFYSLDRLPASSNGYAWYQDAGKDVLKKYKEWKAAETPGS